MTGPERQGLFLKLTTPPQSMLKVFRPGSFQFNVLRSICAALFILLSAQGSAQLHIHLESLPKSTPEGASIFLAANINQWQASATGYSFSQNERGEYWLHIPEASGNLEFKFTRGSWKSVEAGPLGRGIANRTYAYSSEDTIHVIIAAWEDLDGDQSSRSTANNHVKVWDSAMWIPQLKRSREITVYLPGDYHSSNKQYRVIYMLDGQNIFDNVRSYAGEWRVDETLARLESKGMESAIVIAIDNGGPFRISEYSPYPNEKYGTDEGHAYIRFIVETLKPRVDKEFRVKQGPQNTAIVGSSLGALIAHYAYFKYPKVFGRVGIFSPSYWFLPEFFDLYKHPESSVESRIYMLAGGLEEGVPARTREMYQRFMEGGFDKQEVKLTIDPKGNHSEQFWANNFEEAYLWLFEGNLP